MERKKRKNKNKQQQQQKPKKPLICPGPWEIWGCFFVVEDTLWPITHAGFLLLSVSLGTHGGTEGSLDKGCTCWAQCTWGQPWIESPGVCPGRDWGHPGITCVERITGHTGCTGHRGHAHLTFLQSPGCVLSSRPHPHPPSLDRRVFPR